MLKALHSVSHLLDKVLIVINHKNRRIKATFKRKFQRKQNKTNLLCGKLNKRYFQKYSLEERQVYDHKN